MMTTNPRRPDVTTVEIVGGIEKRDLYLVDHDPAWASAFTEHEQRIRAALGAAAVLVEHIGSTSVPGLAAKPIIDVLVTVEDITAEEDYLDQLLAAGYDLRVREPAHRLVRTPERDVHVHVLEVGAVAADDYLLFRDHLRRHRAERELYERTKRALVEQEWADMNAYADAKTDVIVEIKDRARGSLRVMSFNLRFASDAPPHSWPERRPVVRQLLQRERPHVIGTQEGLPQQLRDVQADLPDSYESIGLGREIGGAGEAMQVFYDSDRLRALEHGHYWLSDTPDVAGSQTWGGSCPRMATWVRFEDRRTGGEFYVLNTHLEAFDPGAREKSAALIRRRISEDFDPALPVVLTGDFNEAAGAGPVYDALVTDGPFMDTWEAAAERTAPFATFHGYAPLVPDGDRIDWILATPGVVTSYAAAITFEQDGQYPSDHLPVQAVLRLPVR